MADIFVSHSLEDRDKTVKPVVKLLERQGWSVCWNPEVKQTEDQDLVLEREIEAARVVLVLWTPTSRKSRHILAQADLAQHNGTLFGVSMLGVKPPLRYRLTHRTDLSHWKGKRGAMDAKRFVQQVKETLAKNPPKRERSKLLPSGDGCLFNLMSIALMLAVISLVTNRPTTRPPSETGPALDTPTVEVPRGDFYMGCAEADPACEDDERPLRSVYVADFAIDQIEVTVIAYAECVDRGGCTPPDTGDGCNWNFEGARADHPMNCVDWFQASAFCKWVGRRLPSEEEWEKAARGWYGPIYPWGDEAPGCERVVMAGETDGCGTASTAPVATKLSGASPYGLVDMAGNVAEWTASAYRPGQRVVRGGSWRSGPEQLRSSDRQPQDAGARTDEVGFRCAQRLLGVSSVP